MMYSFLNTSCRIIMNDKKILVSFFSASGETARLAKTLAEVVNGDIYEIKPKKKICFS